MDRRFLGATAAAAVLAVGSALYARTSRRKSQRNPDAAVPYGRGKRIERHVTIAREPADVYAAWRDLESLPLVMPNLKHVATLDASRTRWTAVGPAGTTVTWDAQLIDDRPNERIAWRSSDAPISHAGAVRFTPAPGGRGTEVAVEIEYVPPGGPLGTLVSAFAQAPPKRFFEVDLRRFKSILEAGDVALNGTDVKS